MANWASIAGGFQTRLETITGLRAYSEWPDQFSPPGAIVIPAPTFISDSSFDGGFDATFDILVLISRSGGDARSQVSLLGYFADTGSGSVRAAILGDPTLGGTCDAVIPGEVFGYGTYEVVGVTYTGMKCRWGVLI